MHNYFADPPGAKFYRSLPYLYASICILELIFGLVLLITLSGRLGAFNGTTTKITTRETTTTSGTTITGTTTTETTTTGTTTIPIPQEVITKVLTAYGIAFAGSIVPIFTGIVLLLSMCSCCVCWRNEHCRRPFLRFVSLNCDCPCYVPRPKLRFTVRIGFHLFCILLRIAAIINYRLLYDEISLPQARKVLQMMSLITSVCLIFPFLTVLLDLYHYRVWWAYQPIIDTSNISPDIARKSFSCKHKRFIPYVLTERFRTPAPGNRKCQYGNRCQGRELEHVVIFHSSNYQPQPRWSKSYPTYIGFHRTTPQAAFSIAKTEFKPSERGMLGPGAYFARSIDATLRKIGKADQIGAWFVAEISMGNVFEVEEHSIRRYTNNTRYDANVHRFVSNGDWCAEYDTCYLKHHDDTSDEFCIKDPAKQILRWVVVIEPPYDRKLYFYGLHDELNSRSCGCC